jgi:O-antigen/teichoic acid export membrane protein
MTQRQNRSTTASLRRNTAWALAGNLGYAACQWGVLVAIAKLAAADAVGRFALGLAIAGPVLILSNLNLRAVQATDARRQYDFGDYLGLRLTTIAAALVVITAIALAAGYRGDTLVLLLGVALAKAFEAVSDVVFGLLQQAERLRRVALSLLLKGVASVLTVTSVLRLTGSVVLAVLAMAGCWAGVLTLVDLPAAACLASLRPTFARHRLAKLAWLAFPLGCVMGINSLATNVPRYAIATHLGVTALGHFTAVVYVLVAASQPVFALGAAISPRLARYFIADRRAYVRLSRNAMLLAAALGVLAVTAAAVAGPRFLRTAYAPEYAADAPALCWIAVVGCVGFVSSTLGFAVTAARRFPQQLAVACLALGVCALASQWLVPRFGLIGAAWALLASEGVRLLCLGLVYVLACVSDRGAVSEVRMSGVRLNEASILA